MKYIEGKSREQLVLFPVSLDEAIGQENEVRIIELFVQSIFIETFGFRVKQTDEGRPAYHPKDLLKLYIYGYLNRIRSSRQLERECYRNIELMWLLKELKPDHNTISNFRRDNPDGIREVFRSAVRMAKHFQLIGAKLIAGDSVKLRAQNSKKNNFNSKKIERHLAYIDAKISEHETALAQADGDDQVQIEKQITKQKERKTQYKALQKQLDQTGEVQVSTSDPDSRQMIIRNNITEVAYNIQATVDAKHNLPVDYHITNENDSKAMGQMLSRAVDILETNEFTALYDKGYHTGSELKQAEELGVNVMVAVPEVASHAPDTDYDVENFVYDSNTDTYTCPQKRTLSTNGNWYNKGSRKYETKVKHYKTTACRNCPFINSCTKNTQGRGRVIERSQYQELFERNRKRIEADKETYKRRQAIAEHPFGTIKRQWDFSYIMTKKGLGRASADVGLIFTAYLLRRLMNILGESQFKVYLRGLYSVFSTGRAFKETLKAFQKLVKEFFPLFDNFRAQNDFLRICVFSYLRVRGF